MTRRYAYTVDELDGQRREIQCKGEVESPTVVDAAKDAMADSFRIIHEGGYTVYGQPGAGACRGPYTITRLTLELIA